MHLDHVLHEDEKWTVYILKVAHGKYAQYALPCPCALHIIKSFGRQKHREAVFSYAETDRRQLQAGGMKDDTEVTLEQARHACGTPW